MADEKRILAPRLAPRRRLFRPPTNSIPIQDPSGKKHSTMAKRHDTGGGGGVARTTESSSLDSIVSSPSIAPSVQTAAKRRRILFDASILKPLPATAGVPGLPSERKPELGQGETEGDRGTERVVSTPATRPARRMFRPVLKDAPQARGRDAAQGEKSSKSTPTEPESSSHQEAGGGQRTEKGRSSNASSYLQGQRPACSRKTKDCSGVSPHDGPCDKDTKSGRSVEESNFPTTPKPKDWCTVETGGDFSGRRGDLGVPRSVNGCSAGSPCQSLNGQKLDNKEGSARSELGIFQRLPCIPLSTLPHWGDVGVDLAIPSAKIALERVPQMSKATDSISKGSRLVAGATATLVNLQNEMKPRRVQNTSTVHNRQLVFGLIFDDGVLCSSNERPLETIVKLPPWIYDPNDRPAKGLHEPRSLEGTMHRSAARISSHNTNGKNSGSFDGCAVEEVSLDSCQDEEFRLILANQTRQQEEVAKASETTFQISFDFLRRMCE